ncbi:MAG: ATP synthase F1 subunit delta [Saprospiraceae bacterium]
MSVTRIANRYAKSIIELAQDQGKLEPVHHDFQQLGIAAQNRDFQLLLKSPIIHADKKIAVVEALFKDKVDELTLAYLRLLIQKGREQYVTEIVAEFEQQYRSIKHITQVRITSATPLSDKVLDTLKSKILASGKTQENLEMETVIDPSLIGGFVIEFDDKRYDASITSKLDDLQKLFSKNLYVREI